MKRIIKLIIALAAGVLSAANLKAQILNPLFDYDPTPKALEVIRYGNLPLSLNSGRMSFEVPVYTYQDQDFTIPVTLAYSSSGFRPGAPTSEAGLGWTLMAGGMITREINGLDDFSVGGYYGLQDFNQEELYENLSVIEYMEHRPTIQNGRETTADVFHFTFMGYSGNFVTMPGSSFQAYGTPDGLGTYKIRYDYGGNCFTITTSDGFKYEFGSSDSSREILIGMDPLSATDEFSANRILTSSEKTTISWMLDRIIAPDGRHVTFTYSGIHGNHSIPQEEDDVVTTFSNKLDVFEDRQVLRASCIRQTTYLTSIDIHDLDVISPRRVFTMEWEYKSGNEMGTESNSDYTRLVKRTKRISRIVVQDCERTLRVADLCYTFNGTRDLLSGVKISGLGDYAFDYLFDPYHPLPGLTSNAVDHWGFYNGRDNNSEEAIATGARASDSNYNEYLSGDYMDPDYTYSRLGMLCKIKYPTGGSTVISYSANQADNILLRRKYGANGVEPSDPHNPGLGENFNSFLTKKYSIGTMLHSSECGGVRVCSLTDYDNLGNSSTRTYSYSKGLSLNFRRLVVSMVAGCSSFSPNLRFPAASFDSFHVAYSQVTEHLPDGSSAVSYYTGWNDFPDTFSNNKTRIFPGDSPTNGEDSEFSNNIQREPDSKSYLRGLLKKQEFYSPTHQLLKRKEFNYTSIGSLRSVFIVSSGDYWWSAGRAVCDVRIESVSETNFYHDAPQLHESEAYMYDELGRLTKTVSTLSDGSVREKHMAYRNTGYRTDLVSREAIYAKKPWDNSSSLEETMDYTYIQNGNLWNLCSANKTSYSANSSGGFNPTVADTYTWSNHDRYGNPGQITVNGQATSYIWGYKGRYPIARLVNFSYQNLPQVFRSEYQENLSELECDQLLLLPNASVTAYEYIPSVGVTRIIHSSGRSSYYSYDANGRLIEESDDQGSLCSYSYDYYHEGADSLRFIGRTIIGTEQNRESACIYDGLGRPCLEWSGSFPGNKRILRHEYDVIGRERFVHLPYLSDSLSIPMASSAQISYWAGLHGSQEGAFAFSEADFDNTLAVRSMSFTTEGAAMRAADKKMRTTITSNHAGELARIRYEEGTGMFYVDSCIPAGSLIKTVSVNPEGCTSITFCNSDGTMVLDRQLDGTSETDTYYVYDKKNALVLVVMPSGGEQISAAAREGRTMQFSDGDTFADRHCHIYRYDGKGDLKSYKQPGMKASGFVYNEKHQLKISTPNLFDSYKLQRVYTYDGLGRLTKEALVEPDDSFVFEGPDLPSLNSTSRLVHPQERNWPLVTRVYASHITPYSQVPDYLSFEAVGGIVQGYDTRVGGDLIMEVRNVVDTSFIKGGLRLVNGRKTTVAADPTSSSKAETAYYYDIRGNVVQSVTRWPDGTRTRYSYLYDRNGDLLKKAEHYSDSTGLSICKMTECSYNSRGEMTGRVTSIGDDMSFVTSYTYDACGRVADKTISMNGRELSSECGYTIQGWPCHTQSRLDGEIIFEQNLEYWNTSLPTSIPRYDGMVAESNSSHVNHGVRTVSYLYDNLCRLSTATGLEENISYDKNGNITCLVRYDAAGQSPSVLQMDYYANKLSRVGFLDSYSGMALTNTYDDGGNIQLDVRTGLTYLYNALGKISEVGVATGAGAFFSFSPVSHFEYLADGTKLSTSLADESEIIYRGTFIFSRSSAGVVVLNEIMTDDGIVLPADINGNSSYRLFAFVTDYLGSVRSVVDMPSGTVVEENDYYPLGLRIADPSLEESSLNRWRYNAKEDLSGIAGIPFSDYGARLADHFTGRWIAPDPMAEKYYAISPYVFCNNNSVIFADLDGELPQVIVGALGGAGVDIVSQMVVNAVSGNNIFDIDAKSVMISAIAGASGVGLANVVKKASAAYKLGKAATSAAQVTANALVDGAESVTKSLAKGEEVKGADVAVDVAIGAISSKAGDMGRKAAESTNEFKYLERQLDRANRLANGPYPEPSRVRKAADAQQKVQNYVENEGKKKENSYKILLGTIHNIIKKNLEE